MSQQTLVTTCYALFDSAMRYALLVYISAANTNLEKVFQSSKISNKINFKCTAGCFLHWFLYVFVPFFKGKPKNNWNLLN